MAEVPSNVREGPDKAIQSLVEAVEHVLELTGVPMSCVRAIGLDTPGPASADGVISSKGATNFGDAGWGGFDIRSALSVPNPDSTAHCPRSWAPGWAAG